MTKLFKLCKLSALLALTGWSCVAAANGNETMRQESHVVYPTMAIPLQPSLQNEINIAKLNQLLLREDLSEGDRAKACYERGRYYDNLGLRDLARVDFNQSLSIDPRQPLIYNRLGVYFTHVGEFDAAYEAFDSALELDPGNQDALRNRAVALYYGNRTALAHEDMLAHYQNDPGDPFRTLWLFIIESEMDQQAALESLAQRYEKRTDDWNWVLAGIMLGKISEETAFDLATQGTSNNTLMAQRLTEAYFYLGKRFKIEGEFTKAMSLYKLAISLNVYNYVEHGYAFLELGKLYQEYKAASRDGKANKFVQVMQD